ADQVLKYFQTPPQGKTSSTKLSADNMVLKNESKKGYYFESRAAAPGAKGKSDRWIHKNFLTKD
ncbi:MAG: hypothetical protein K2Z81_06490, partial [Cyanobacteria bacterium]|nr:hypothetical protein [Cyanobacteriota bacterium]